MGRWTVRKQDDKWKVRKRDGTWWVLDSRGVLRYSAGSHEMALAFALMRGSKPPYMIVFDHSTPTAHGEGEVTVRREQILDEVLEALSNTDYEEDDDE